jgi:hypothetical protein
MAEWQPSPETVENAKVMAAGGFGALVFVFLRHPGTVLRALMHVGIGMGLALVFADMVVDWFGLSIIPAAVLIGHLGKPVAESALRAAEKLEISTVFKVTKGPDDE